MKHLSLPFRTATMMECAPPPPLQSSPVGEGGYKEEMPLGPEEEEMMGLQLKMNPHQSGLGCPAATDSRGNIYVEDVRECEGTM